MVGPTKRLFVSFCVYFTFCIGNYILLLMAFLIRDWTILYWAITVPIGAYIIVLLWVNNLIKIRSLTPTPFFKIFCGVEIRESQYRSHASGPVCIPMKIVIARLWKWYWTALHSTSNPIGRKRSITPQNISKGEIIGDLILSRLSNWQIKINSFEQNIRRSACFYAHRYVQQCVSYIEIAKVNGQRLVSIA